MTTTSINGRRRALGQLAAYLAVCAFILVLPQFLPNEFLLNRIARYLVLAMVTMALALSWGYAGILNLGQAMSFGIGSYCIAMALKLKTIPVHTGSDGLPDFMVWNNVTTLPWFWQPFHSLAFGIVAGMVLPALAAGVLGWFIFRGRVSGVFVAIITLATMIVVSLLIIDQQQYTGGFNGITDLGQLKLFGITFDAYSSSTYYLVTFSLIVSLGLALAVTKSKTGLVVQAIRDQENRVRFFGYDVTSYKTLVLMVSAAIAGLAGMLYTIVMEFASPTFMSVELSLSIVIWCAVGGRQSLIGAMLGAVLVTGMQGALSESETFLDSWTLIMGALFVVIVLFLPNGLASLISKGISRWRQRRSAAAVSPSAVMPGSLREERS